MNLFSTTTEIQGLHYYHAQSSPPYPFLSPTHLLSLQNSKVSLSTTSSRFFTSRPNFKFTNVRVTNVIQSSSSKKVYKIFDEDDLTVTGDVYKKTLRLVECAMFAALGGLTYILSSSLAIENYFGCFFALPIVFSSMRWGLAAGRKTMVATVILLLVLAGPVKALTYMLMYGLLGVTMGSLWRLRASWGLSVGLTAIVRALGATSYVIMYSFLIKENILALITINIHASLTYILTSLGFVTIPTMNTIYAIFGILVFINCSFFVFLLHLLYSVFFARLGMKDSLKLPGWLEKAI